MITALCWVPKGACKYTPEVAEPPSKEEIEELIKSGILDPSGDGDEDVGEEEGGEEEDGEMDMDLSEKNDEVAKALAVAHALGKARGSTSAGGFNIEDALRELNMDNYDEEDDGIVLFSSGLGDAYYPSNELDPYLLDKDDEDDEEIEDLNVRSTDGVVICAHHEDDVSQLEVLVYEDSNDGEANMFVHHEILLAAYPLCLAWSDCNLKTGDRGNFIAVGTMDPAIEIWDLDIVDEAEPFRTLGGTENSKKSSKKIVKYKKDSHKDAVLSLAWNKEIRNVLASASADKSVKVWDVVTGQCALTVKHHSDKVQSVIWNRHSPEVLLSGSFDHTVNMMDMRSNAQVINRWSVPADVESLAWSPHLEHSFVVSMENGTIQGFDTRSTTDSSSSPSPIFTLHAHDKAVCSVSYSPCVPNLLATGSMDKMVKLWDLSNNQPSCVVSKNLKAGAIFTLSFYEDSPSLLAIGGSKGKLQVWDISTDHAIANRYNNVTGFIRNP